MNIYIIIGCIVGAILVLLLNLLKMYNGLVDAKNKVENQFSQIDVQLKRRIDLIPNLVETVKGYATHESETFKEVIEARNACNSASTSNDKIDANNQLSGVLNKLFAVAEAYPDLKANENFIKLQTDLKDTEDKISFARQFYNDTVMKFNNLVQMFPSNIVAKIFNFKKANFFEIEESEKVVPEVKF